MKGQRAGWLVACTFTLTNEIGWLVVACLEVGEGDTMTYMNLPNEALGVDAMSNSRHNAERDGRAPEPTSEPGAKMRIAPWYLAALAPFAAVGYSGAHLGYALVVLLTVGIFLGTLSMRRPGSDAMPRA